MKHLSIGVNNRDAPNRAKKRLLARKPPASFDNCVNAKRLLYTDLQVLDDVNYELLLLDN